MEKEEKAFFGLADRTHNEVSSSLQDVHPFGEGRLALSRYAS
jgi:hypothetical protein